MIGNDIVDVHFVDRPPYQHVGHLERVCSTEELLYMREAERPSLMLAALWACKEATYKLFSRESYFPFVPKKFVVRSNSPIRLTASETVIVSYSGIPASVELSVTNEWVHAISISPAAQIVRWKVREIEATSRDGLQPQGESEAVRSLAAELTSTYCERDVLQGFQGRIPILTGKAGGHVPIKISFSHHGRFVAVAMAWPFSQPRRISQSLGFAGQTSLWEETCSTCTA